MIENPTLKLIVINFHFRVPFIYLRLECHKEQRMSETQSRMWIGKHVDKADDWKMVYVQCQRNHTVRMACNRAQSFMEISCGNRIEHQQLAGRSKTRRGPIALTLNCTHSHTKLSAFQAAGNVLSTRAVSSFSKRFRYRTLYVHNRGFRFLNALVKFFINYFRYSPEVQRAQNKFITAGPVTCLVRGIARVSESYIIAQVYKRMKY